PVPLGSHPLDYTRRQPRAAGTRPPSCAFPYPYLPRLRNVPSRRMTGAMRGPGLRRPGRTHGLDRSPVGWQTTVFRLRAHEVGPARPVRGSSGAGSADTRPDLSGEPLGVHPVSVERRSRDLQARGRLEYAPVLAQPVEDHLLAKRAQGLPVGRVPALQVGLRIRVLRTRAHSGPKPAAVRPVDQVPRRL